MPSKSSNPEIIPIFQGFREELDRHHDSRERIVKASRDITAASKKIIFALQRTRSMGSDIPKEIFSDVQERSVKIQEQFALIAPFLVGINAWRYQRQISPGLQEYVEAKSFEHYLRHQRLIGIDEINASLPDGTTLNEDDYLLGIFDLTGELMRFSITAMATTGVLPTTASSYPSGRNTLMDLRAIRASLQGLDTISLAGTALSREIEKKAEVMRTSVEKVEHSMYTTIVRGAEGRLPEFSEFERIE